MYEYTIYVKIKEDGEIISLDKRIGDIPKDQLIDDMGVKRTQAFLNFYLSKEFPEEYKQKHLGLVENSTITIK